MSSDYTSMKVVDLKKELKARNLSTVGNKEDLIERLQNADTLLDHSSADIDNLSENMMENDILEDELSGLDYVEDEDEMLKKSADLDFASVDVSPEKADISQGSNNSLMDATVIEVAEKPQEKKVHLIRNRVFSASEDDKEMSEGKISEEGEKKVITLKPKLTPEERLALRRQKFGQNTVDEKKAARAIRFGIQTPLAVGGASSKVLSTIPISKLGESAEVLKRRADRFGLASVSLGEYGNGMAKKSRVIMSSVDDTEEKKKRRAERFNIKT